MRFCACVHVHTHKHTLTLSFHSVPTSREPVTGLPWPRLSLEVKVLTALIKRGQWQEVVSPLWPKYKPHSLRPLSPTKVILGPTAFLIFLNRFKIQAGKML